MFETFDIPSLLLLPQDLLAVLSAGKSTAVVVDAGLGATTVSVLYNMTRPAGRPIAVTMVTRGVTMVTRGVTMVTRGCYNMVKEGGVSWISNYRR